MRILCVCLGNICRSPMAEAVLGARAQAAGLRVEVDSAGTGGWHLDEAPHPTGQAVAAARGYDTSRQRARRVEPEDFHAFDLILAMDHANLGTLLRLRPAGARAELRLFDGTVKENSARLALESAGSRIPSSNAMIAMTTSSSISVNPRRMEKSLRKMIKSGVAEQKGPASLSERGAT